jgi:hypothetical protein
MTSVPFAWRPPQQNGPNWLAGPRRTTPSFFQGQAILQELAVARYGGLRDFLLHDEASFLRGGGFALGGPGRPRWSACSQTASTLFQLDRLFQYPKVGFALVASTISSFHWWSQVRTHRSRQTWVAVQYTATRETLQDKWRAGNSIDGNGTVNLVCRDRYRLHEKLVENTNKTATAAAIRMTNTTINTTKRSFVLLSSSLIL